MIVRLLHLCDYLIRCSLVLRRQESTLAIQLSHLGSQRSEKDSLDKLSPELHPPVINDEVGGLGSIWSNESINYSIAVPSRHILLILFHEIGWLAWGFRWFEV